MKQRALAGVALVLLCGGGATAAPSDTPPRGWSTAPALCTREPPTPGIAAHAIATAAGSRVYTAYVPRNLPRERPAPLVIAIHGSGSTPRQHLALSRLDAEAERRGFVVVLPEAIVPWPQGGTTWNVPAAAGGPDDVEFVDRVVNDAALRWCVDGRRVYVTGFSGGARLASEFACARPLRVAGLGAVGGLRAPERCAGPVPVIAFHGTADPVNPYAGGRPEYWSYGVETAASRWAGHNRCRSAPPAIAGDRLEFGGCARGANVRLHRLPAGHQWPGAPLTLPPGRFGPPDASIDATAAMLEFFGVQVLDE